LGAAHGSAESDAGGAFTIVVSRPGTYVLQATRLGYQTTRTRPIEIGEGEVVELELQLDVRAVELDPLTVVVRRRENQRERDLREYYERVEYYGEPHLGPIRIFTREYLEGWEAFRVADIMRFHAPRWRTFGRGCAPQVYVDGRPQFGALAGFYTDISVWDIEGIEFYTGTGPAQSRFWDPYGCGVVLVWTRPLEEDAHGLDIVATIVVSALLSLFGVWLIH
jgi:hypothetical protein